MAGAALIVSRGDAHHGAEHQSEVTLIAKANLMADFRDGLVRRSEQRLGLGDAVVVEIGNKRLPRHLLEETHKVGFAHADNERRFLHRYWLSVPAADEIEQRRQAREVPLFAPIGGHAAVGSRVMIPQQNENHLEVSSCGQPATAVPGRQFGRSAQNQVEDLRGDTRLGRDYVGEIAVLRQERHQIFDIVARLFRAADEFGKEGEQRHLGRLAAVGAQTVQLLIAHHEQVAPLHGQAAALDVVD